MKIRLNLLCSVFLDCFCFYFVSTNICRRNFCGYLGTTILCFVVIFPL